jgi:hypothetical protein
MTADASLAELRELTEHALADGLRDAQRGRWRELVAQLLGRTQSHDGTRKHIRGAAGLDVHVLEPDDLMGLLTSTVGGEIGAVFTDAVQSDRELLEAIAVRALLAPGGMLPP